VSRIDAEALADCSIVLVRLHRLVSSSCVAPRTSEHWQNVVVCRCALHWPFVNMSVRPSVSLKVRYCVKAAKDIVEILSQPDSLVASRRPKYAEFTSVNSVLTVEKLGPVND